MLFPHFEKMVPEHSSTLEVVHCSLISLSETRGSNVSANYKMGPENQLEISRGKTQLHL